MTSKGRRTGVAAGAVLSLCLGLTGCVNTQSAQQPVLHSTNCSQDYRGGTAAAGIRPYDVPALYPNGSPVLTHHSAAKFPTTGQPAGGPEIVQAGFLRKGSLGQIVRPGQPVSHEAPPVEAVPGEAVPVDGTTVEGQVLPGPVAHGPVLPGPATFGPVCPRELEMKSHPPYTVAPPDILLIDALRLVPKGPYRLEPLEVLQIALPDGVRKDQPGEAALPKEPIGGLYMISPEGTINLGFNYGSVRVGGLTVEQAQAAVRKHLSGILKNPDVNLALVQFRGMQQIRGEHLVRPDGTVSLGSYGSVYVAGMTLGQVKCVIEKYLSAYLINPQVSVDVLAYNSKKYYVVMDGGGFGQQVIPLPATGNETVLDAISLVQGLAPVSSKKRIWIARPSPVHLGCNQILPVDWEAIVAGGSTATNYQIFPGDRVYVQADRLIAFDNYLSKILAPVERVFGITLLGSTTVRSLQGGGGGNGVFVPIIP